MLCDSTVTDDISTNPGFGMHFSIRDDDNTDPDFVAFIRPCYW